MEKLENNRVFKRFPKVFFKKLLKSLEKLEKLL